MKQICLIWLEGSIPKTLLEGYVYQAHVVCLNSGTNIKASVYYQLIFINHRLL